jgi:hypothetical protein
VFEVAASRTPDSRSLVSSVETSTVSPGSSSSNSSTHTNVYDDSAATASWNPSAPTRWVSSTKVANSLGPGTACHSEASRCVLPTP